MELTILAIFGFICSAVAHSRGRSAVGWFFIGLIFGCLPLVILFVIPDLNVEQAKQERRERQYSRLKERQVKDRATVDRKLAAQDKRLDVHDQALGVDTIEAETSTAAAPPSRRVSPAFPEDVDWYYAVDDETEEEVGPVTFADVHEAFRSGILNEQSVVWHENMKDWAKIAKVPGLTRRLEDFS